MRAPFWIPAAIAAAALAACGGGASSTSSGPTLSAANDTATVAWNTGTAVPVLANDTGAGTAATLSIVTPPAHGTASVDGNTIVYTPAAGYFGSDTLRYALADGGASAQADVALTVKARFTVSGTVRDAVLPGASVVVSIGDTTLPPVTAGTDGTYQVEVETADPTAFVRLQATGAGAQSGVVLSSLVADASLVAAAAGSGNVDATALPALNVTNVSTAVAVLSEQTLGHAVASSADLSAAQGRFTAGQTVEMATAIKLVADAGVQLPAGSADTLSLVSDPNAFKAFVTAQVTSDPTTFQQTQDAVLGDASIAVAPPVPSAGATTTLLLVQGEGAATQAATRLVLSADGSARVEGQSVTAATWTTNGSEIDVTYATPLVSTGYSSDVDPQTHYQNQVQETDTGFQLRQIGGTPGAGPATVRAIASLKYLDGSRAGTVVQDVGTWDAQTMVGTPVGFTDADVAAGKRWAGVVAVDFDPTTSGGSQDVLHIDDASHATLERTHQSGSFALVDGKLQLTLGSAVYTYTRLFAGPWGEERWLVEKAVQGSTAWVTEAAAVPVADGASFTTQALVHDWQSYINVGVASDQFRIALASNGSGQEESVAPDGTVTPGVSGPWVLDPTSGTMRMSVYGCSLTDPYCQPYKVRSWQPLGSSGGRIYVMERLTVSPSLDQYRVNVYTAQ